MIWMLRCKAILMETESQPLDTGTIGTIQTIDITNTLISMIQIEDNTIQIINGIDTMDGDLLSHQIKLLHHMIQNLTLKVLTTITLMLVNKKTTGIE